MGNQKRGKKSNKHLGKASNTKLMQNEKALDNLSLELDDEYLISTQDDQGLEERRFMWKIDSTQGLGARGDDLQDGAFISMPDKGRLEKHQVNYSATKYIKP